MRIDVKPLSVNESWKGRRFKTDKYKRYESLVYLLLPNVSIPKDCKLKLIIEAGFSSKGSDLDNVIKPFQDILQKRYKFNDSQIYEIAARKVIVKKGSEYIDFKLNKLDE